MPLLVVALITPPPVVPYSAEKAEVCTVNSCTVSGEKLTMVRARLTPVLLVPSAIISVLMGRPPPTLRLQPGQVVTLTSTGFSLPASPRHVGQRQGQVEHAAVQQRNVLNLALRDGAAEAAGLGIDRVLTLMSAIYFAREVLPGMQKRKWGRLITITSMSVKQPVDGLILSNSIRAAVTGLARTLANEFGADGITVNNVAPGYTLTDRLEELSAKRAADTGVAKEKVLEQMTASVPARRAGRPEEFAAAVAFLASERASYLNGTTIAVDGGWVRSLL